MLIGYPSVDAKFRTTVIRMAEIRPPKQAMPSQKAGMACPDMALLLKHFGLHSPYFKDYHFTIHNRFHDARQ